MYRSGQRNEARGSLSISKAGSTAWPTATANCGRRIPKTVSTGSTTLGSIPTRNDDWHAMGTDVRTGGTLNVLVALFGNLVAQSRLQNDAMARGRATRQRPRMRSISVICSAASGPSASAPQFSSTWATVLNPGIGTVRGLRAQIQARAPWASVRPSLVSTSRMAASLSSHSAVGLPSRNPGCHCGDAALVVGGERAVRGELAGQQAHAERPAVDAGEVELLADLEHLRIVVVEHAEPLLHDAAPRQRRERPHRVGSIGAPAVRADQAFVDELFEHVTRLQGAFDGESPDVQLVDVDVVGAEPPQAGLDIPAELAGDVAVASSSPYDTTDRPSSSTS